MARLMAGRGGLSRILPPLVSAAIIAVAAVVLYRTLAGIDAADVTRQFAAIPGADLWMAAFFTAMAFLSLAVYEVAMLRYIGSGLPDWRPLLTALIAYPVGHAVGFGALSGGAVRYRFYAAEGLTTFDVGKVVVLSVMPYAAGLGVLCGLSLVFDATDAATLMQVAPHMALAGGALLLAAHAAYLAAVLRLRGPVNLRWLQVELPSPRMTAVQYGLGLVDALCGISVLYVLLPAGADVAFTSFVAVYVIAIFVGLLSSVPAGLGVFESMLLLMLRDVPAEALLGSVLAYRLIYELVPLATGIALFVGWEAWSRRHLVVGAPRQGVTAGRGGSQAPP
jgi:phosphatidylglycerol lysyltransferase